MAGRSSTGRQTDTQYFHRLHKEVRSGTQKGHRQEQKVQVHYENVLNIIYCKYTYQNVHTTLRKKCPYLELFWSVFSRIRTEYGEILSISPYSVQMWGNTDQKKPRIWTPFTQCEPFWSLIKPKNSLQESTVLRVL